MKMLGHSCTKMGRSPTGRGRRGVTCREAWRAKMKMRGYGRREQRAGSRAL